MFKTKMWTRLGLAAFGLVLAMLIVEIGFRITFVYLPLSIQDRLLGVRLWGLGGSALGLFANNYEWTRFCRGDERLYARLFPDLNEEPVRNRYDIFHITTSTLGFENIGFRTGESSGPWDGVVVGDSFTFCWGVEMQECWVSQLAEKTEMRLANLSLSNTGSVSHLHYLQDYGWTLNPQIIIWQYWVNDPVDDYRHIVDGAQGCPRLEEKNDTSPGLEKDNLEIENNTPPENKPMQGLRDWLSHTFVTYNLVTPVLRVMLPQFATLSAESEWESILTTNEVPITAWTRNPLPDDPQNIIGMELTQEAILTAAQEASEHDTPFLLVLAPSPLQVYIDSLPSARFVDQAKIENTNMDNLIAFAEENGIQYLDLRPVFRKAAMRGDEIYFTQDIHWTPDGNRLVADALADWFQETALFRTNKD